MTAQNKRVVVEIPPDLLKALAPLVEARGTILEKYIQEKLWFVVEINKSRNPEE